jgi:hypothetical protein
VTPHQLIDRLRAVWHAETGPAGRRAAWALLAGAIVGASWIGRAGTDHARAAAAAVLVLGLVPLLARWMVLRRRARDARAVMDTTVMRTQPALAQAALRAMRLNDTTRSDERRGSAELAQLHLARLLGRAALDPIAGVANRRAWLWTALGLVLAATALAVVLLDPFRLLEGYDVMAARDGRAPVKMRWVELPDVYAEPPSYLGQRRRPLRPYFPTAVPNGTDVTVRASALHQDRELVLSDGKREVPFLDDGAGSLVAHWTVMGDARLSVSARFGDVLIEEPRSLELHAIADQVPFVRLDGAPRTLRLLEHDRIPIHYEVRDDHGLREVALVLRAGDREERRVLSKPQSGGRVDRGGMVLHADDPFLERSYLPIEITVQARDNDPIEGPKWGRSESIVVIPPAIGEREALRYAALSGARDALVDLLAERVVEAPRDAARAEHRKAEGERQRRAVDDVRRAMDGAWGGLRMPGSVMALLGGQLERLDKALEGERRGALAGAHDKLVTRTESVVLAVDSSLRALGGIDTRRSARKLSEVATEAAESIGRSSEPEERANAERSLDAALLVLDEGGAQLLGLGQLGLDLGEIVANGLRRIHRAWDAGDRYHARLAAEDLAARLRNPDPSFGSAGGGHGGHGGVESGGQQSPAEGEPSEAAKEAAEVMRALEQLRQEHAAEMGAVDQALEQAMSPEERDALKDKLREQAKRVREAVRELPQAGARPDSARSAAASGRASAEAMAGALERGDLNEAIERGKEAVDALERAEKRGDSAPAQSSERRAGDQAGDAGDKLKRELGDAQQAQGEKQKAASEAARGELQRIGGQEGQLSRRARELAQRSGQSEAPLPESMLRKLEQAAESMERASQQLKSGDGHRGRRTQRDAQRLLEMAQPDSDPSGARQSDAPPGDGKQMAKDAEVPGEGRDARADDFRRRVTEGLKGKAPPHLREALRRYTEGLLR